MKEVNAVKRPQQNRKSVTYIQKESQVIDRGTLKVRCGGGFRILRKYKRSK